LAHSSLFGGAQNYTDNHTSHDSLFCAVLTLGEGYHNFHHEFASDYRNGFMWYHYDPTKWLIRLLEIVGFARNLGRVPNEVIARSRDSMSARKHELALQELRAKLDSADNKLAVTKRMKWCEIEDRCSKGEKLIVVDKYVLDLMRPIRTGKGYTHDDKEMIWFNKHPGGAKILDQYIGKDATDAMTGGVHSHSQAAFNLLGHLRVAHIDKSEE